MNTVFLTGNYLDLEVPEFILDLVPITGQADASLEEIVSDKDVIPYLENINKDKLKTELKEYGAWSDEQLEDHEENITRFLWIKILDYKEENF